MWGFHKKRGLRQWVMMILQRSPRNGAEIMDDMEVMTAGWWRPSPGSVYPLLEEMVSEGSLRRREDGRYELADVRERGWNWGAPMGPRSPQEVVREMTGLTAYLEDLKRANHDVTQPIRSELDALTERLRQLRT